MSFFDLVPLANSRENHPGISASEEVWLALMDTLREALDTFQETHPDLTYGDCIHAAKCLANNLIRDWAEDTSDA